MFPWSDNWWIEGDRAWFCGGEINALFCVDMNNGQCELVARIPECAIVDFRLNSYCMKYKDIILCLPSEAKCIWCYDLKKDAWEKIPVDNKEQIFYYQENNNQIFFWDYAGWLYKMDLEEKKVRKIFFKKFQKEEMPQYVIVEDKLYHVRGSKILCLDLNDNDIQEVIYEIPHIKADLFTICFDGTNFWLSGHAKEICVWNPEAGVVRMITDFPEQFGFYHFEQGEIPYLDRESYIDTKSALFEFSIAIGKYVWFIPDRSNDIIFIDKETYKVFMLELEEEQETKESIDNHLMDFKFLLQYIRENRYIGIYSLKNRIVFEIDTIDLCVKRTDYKLSEQSIIMIVEAYRQYEGYRILSEKNENDTRCLSYMLKINHEKDKKQARDIGDTIYHTLSD